MARPSRMTATVLAVTAMYLLVSALLPVAAAETPETQNVMMFPMKNSLGPDKAQMAEDFVIMLKDGLSVTGKFMVMSYDVNSNVCIQRAVAEQQIKADDAKTAYTTDAEGVVRARKVCQAIASDLGIIGSLDNYSFDPATKEAKIGVTVQLIKGAYDSDPLTIVATGIAAGKPDDQSQTESGIALAALNDAADKVLTKLVDATVEPAPAQVVQSQPDEKSSSHRKGLLPAMLGALLLGLVLGGG